MSGLAALFHRDSRPVDQEAMDLMLTSAAHRGLDGLWSWGGDNISLGYAQTCITPQERRGEQPRISRRTGCVIVADVRLDNRDELLTLLDGTIVPDVSDAELVLRGYEKWGARIAERLLGDFAFVIWDPKARHVFCCRDSSGQRTLFYRLDACTFAAASEIQQLLQDPSLPIEPDEERIRDMLVPLNAFRNEKQGARTFFRGISMLPAGHALLVSPSGERLWRYWELKPRRLRYRSDEEYVEHFRELFFEIVRARLRSDFPLGVLLSGGLDSSSVTCSAQQLYRDGRAVNHGFVTFTSTFDGLDCDERPYIEDMQALYGFDARYIEVRSQGGRLQIEPAGFREAPNLGVQDARDAILAEARSAGVRAILNGDIGDSCVFGSRLVFDSLLRSGNLKAFGRHLRAYRRASNETARKIAALYVATPLLPLGVEKRVMSAYLRRLINGNRPYLLPSWMPEGLRDELAKRHLRLALEAERRRKFTNDTHESEYRMLYPPEVARHPAPWPIEFWRPFADRRMHEFMLSIPPEQQFEPHPDSDDYYAGSKRIVRRAMRGVLPESVRTRTDKTVFSDAWGREIAHQWPVYQAVFGPGSQSEVAERGYIDRERFWVRLQRLRDEPDANDTVYVMRILELETWLRSLRLPREQAVTVAMRTHLVETSSLTD